MLVDQGKYEQVKQRKAELEDMIREIEQLQDQQEELIRREQDVREMISELEQRGNDFSDDVDAHGQDILQQGLRLDRVSERNRKERRSMRKGTKGKKKVVRQGKEMSKVNRGLRIADGAAKIILSLLP